MKLKFQYIINDNLWYVISDLVVDLVVRGVRNPEEEEDEEEEDKEETCIFKYSCG
jgi:hypothetical protein